MEIYSTTILLTAEGMPLGPIVWFFGWIMNGIYTILANFGIESIGVAIILFTLITRIILYPLTVQQQKSSKLMSLVQPELQAIQKKYEGLGDRQSMMMQQSETRAVYEKYGISMSGSCLQLLIQMPILIALYRVIMNIPAYVGVIKNHFTNIVDAMVNEIGEGGLKELNFRLAKFVGEKDGALKMLLNSSKTLGFNLKPDDFQKISDISEITKVAEDAKLKDFAVDFLYKCSPNQLKELFSSFGEEVQNVATTNMEFINEANSFCGEYGLNMATAPNVNGLHFMVDGHFNAYLLIPVLAFLSQFLSSWLMQKMQDNKRLKSEQENQMAGTMKTMMWTMPLVSAFFTWSLASGLGLYWIASAAFMCIQQLIVNAQMSKLNMNELLKKNIEKANKKRAKKHQPLLDTNVTIESIQKQAEKETELAKKRETIVEKTKEDIEEKKKFYFGDEPTGSSLFDFAGMVDKYNSKNK